jgi:uncharacterized RmlC-like cupin family protein
MSIDEYHSTARPTSDLDTRTRTRSRPRPVVVKLDTTASLICAQNQNITPMIHSGVAPWCQGSSYRIYMPAGHVATMHLHDDTEVQVCILDGWAATITCDDTGDDLEATVHGPGQIICIPAGRAHTAVNLSTKTGLYAVEFRPRDPDCNRDVRLLPELQHHADAVVGSLQREHAERILDARVAGGLPW